MCVIVLIQNLNDHGLLTEIWGFLKIGDICRLLIASKHVREICLTINKLISQRIIIWSWSKGTNEKERNILFNNILKSFPKISCLDLLMRHNHLFGYTSLSLLYNSKSICNNLTELSVSMNVNGVRGISKLQNLRSLNISESKITNKGFEEICLLLNIEVLNIALGPKKGNLLL